MDENKDQRNIKEKLMRWSYTILIWAIPFLHITLFPWIVTKTKFLARNEVSYGPDASTFYYYVSIFFLPIALNLIFGAGVFILGFGIKRYKGKAVLVGGILGVIYALLILSSYLVYFNINLNLFNQIFAMGMYTGPGNPSFILAFYGLLLYQIIKKDRVVESN
ncbi:hypothetical protein [Acetobacterium bakii]|uniref:Uncharacterized protein n=1 Tax=Acetobacterium bakii TaxID=52689 RepID=A0A0L6TVY0_9FIRM|nr:hypothetical protein [Acetobacterium bakii]KNZ40416.1 hypothetical protein AKG39_17815 [Acetobacterium bakii]